jgi:hypothetical protein
MITEWFAPNASVFVNHEKQSKTNHEISRRFGRRSRARPTLQHDRGVARHGFDQGATGFAGGE